MKYYIQRHASGFCGNNPLWWREGGHGYSCNLNEAEVFVGDSQEFRSIMKTKEKYTAWPKSYIDRKAIRTIDHQNISMEEAMREQP